MTENNSATISRLLRLISLKQRQALEHKLKQTTTVTIQQAMILRLIAAQPGLIQKNIVDRVQRRAATVSAALKNLENLGLIVRKIPSTNTRNKEIYLTAQGQQLVADFAAATTTVDRQLTAPLTADQQTQLIQLLTLLVQETMN